MTFKSIFDVFSRHDKQAEPFLYKVPITLRNKVLMFCHEVFSNRRSQMGGGDYTREFWSEIHQMLLYRHGRFQLMEDGSPSTQTEDVAGFLLNCKDEEFLDFVEYIFRVKCLFHVSYEENMLVAELNELFASESVGYEVTEMAKETVVEPTMFGNRPVIKTVAYPQVIRKDDQVVHNLAIKPALQLLSDPKFKTANQEYLEALEDYKMGDYGDCLTKCGSAFESVMKIICDQKVWTYKQTDPAGTLIGIMVKNAGLDSYFEKPFMLIATLRNRLSKSHGAGVLPKTVSQNFARYSLNSTASAIIFLVNETK